METAEFWVLAAFVIFLALMLYFGVQKKLIGGLDARSKRIADDLDEARRLREEAQRVLGEYERKRREAEGEAEAMIASAKAEAERLAAEAKAKAEDFVARRTRMAETKIQQAEAQALADVRAAAADAATAAAGKILQARSGGEVGDALIRNGLQEVRNKLH
jgi:F-type H+-transporting ATPase subunit b